MKYTIVVSAVERYTGMSQDYHFHIEAESVRAALGLAGRDARLRAEIKADIGKGWASYSVTAVYAGWLEDLLPDDYVPVDEEV